MGKGEDVTVSLVLPMHNEEDRVRETVSISEEVLSDYDNEIIITEDGCTDETPEIAEKLAEEGRVKHLHSEERLGRGNSLEKAFSQAKGEILIYMDADLATNPEEIPKLIEALKNDYDVVAGSRYIEGSDSFRTPLRESLSKPYNWLVQFLIGSKIQDHQCGFKGLTREVSEELLPLDDEHWFWDTELLVKAQDEGYKVKEMPVKWKEKDKNSDVNIKNEVPRMGYKTVKLAIKTKLLDKLTKSND